MGEIETVGAEKMGWLDLPHGTSYPTFPYLYIDHDRICNVQFTFALPRKK